VANYLSCSISFSLSRGNSFLLHIDLTVALKVRNFSSRRLNELGQHPTFRNHAAAFASAIGMAVESLDDWDGDLTATLLQLGRMHSETEGFTVQNLHPRACTPAGPVDVLVRTYRRMSSP